jgi:hypothetical protein
MDDTNSKPEPARFPSDRWIGVVLLAVSALMLFETTRFPVMAWDPAGMAFWPRLLIGCLAVVCLWHIVKGRVGEPMERPTGRALALIGVCALYLAATATLGFFVANPLMVAGLLLWYRRAGGGLAAGLAEAVLTAAVATGLIYLVFEYGMGIEMPRGIWG